METAVIPSQIFQIRIKQQKAEIMIIQLQILIQSQQEEIQAEMIPMIKQLKETMMAMELIQIQTTQPTTATLIPANLQRLD